MNAQWSLFRGQVIPSILSTADSAGIPNISYLSHVLMVDDLHIALSNQFFTKTAANIRLNPKAALLLVDGRNGSQYRLDLIFKTTVEEGPHFERMLVHLEASSAQVGMAGVMKLRNLDVFYVNSIELVPSPAEASHLPTPKRNLLAAVAGITAAVAAKTEVEDIVDAVLGGISSQLGFQQALLLQFYPERNQLVTIGSVGYQPSGIGSEVALDEGIVGAAIRHGHLVKISDMSRIRRFGAAVHQAHLDENRTRSIQVPSLADAMTQIAVPLIAGEMIRGVLFLESRQRLAFGRDDEHALSIIAKQAAAALALSEQLCRDVEPEQNARSIETESRQTLDVMHHEFDDSIFVNGEYVIKGVAGRIMMAMLEAHLSTGKREFTNKAIRLHPLLKLPEFKDNLETRLLLLRRRLEEKQLPLKLERAGRGRLMLHVSGKINLAAAKIS